jgi:hypothetical protein
LRGRTLIVDAPDTAYALQAKKILLQQGLKEGADYTVKPVGAGTYRFKAMVESKDNAAAILNLPFTVQAEELGLRSLGRTVDLLGPYQAGGAFVLRAGRQNGETLERYLAVMRALLGARSGEPGGGRVAGRGLKLPAHTAARTYGLVEPSFGFTGRQVGAEGFRKLAGAAGGDPAPGGEAVAPERYPTWPITSGRCAGSTVNGGPQWPRCLPRLGLSSPPTRA